MTLAARLAGKTAAETISVMLAVFARIEPALRKSITFDNDTAFAQHALLRTMRAMTTWFCDAYASWQKGGVENANGRLRRWLPRQIDIDQVSDEEIQDIVIRASRPLSRRSSKSLAKTCKSGSHSPVALGSKIQDHPESGHSTKTDALVLLDVPHTNRRYFSSTISLGGLQVRSCRILHLADN